MAVSRDVALLEKLMSGARKRRKSPVAGTRPAAYSAGNAFSALTRLFTGPSGLRSSPKVAKVPSDWRPWMAIPREKKSTLVVLTKHTDFEFDHGVAQLNSTK